MSLATRARKRMLGVRQARTSNSANLWHLKSPVAERAVMLSGDLSMLLFYYCEGDPTVYKAEYAGASLDLSLGEVEAFADALVVLEDGSFQARALDDGSPRALANVTALRGTCSHHTISVSAGDLLDSSLRIRNWKAAIAAFHRCNGADLRPVVDDVESYIRLSSSATIQSLVRHLGRHQPLHVIGATVLALRERAISSNMDSAPWCMHTRLMRLDHASHR